MRHIRYLFIILLFAASHSLFAQTKGDNEWGISYGYNRATIYSGQEQIGARGGLNVAASYDHYF